MSTFTVEVTSAGQAVSQQLAISVYDPLSITTNALPSVTVGTSYDQLVEASGGSSGYEWTVSAFTLPTGLTLSTLGDAAVISGIPTVVQDATFTLRVTSSDGQFATKAFSIDVVAAQQRQAN